MANVKTRDLIIDCQFGSTGKGLFAGYLAQQHSPQAIAYAPSPNAGHTLLWNGEEYVHKMLPSGITSTALRAIMLGPGSLIDLDRLHMELTQLHQRVPRMKDVELYVHKNAACVYQRHREAEANGGTAPGSTRTGVGAAQMERIKRNPDQCNLIYKADHPVLEHVRLVDTADLHCLSFERLQIESCQGYGLSHYHGMYPYCTSRDVTTASIISDCGLPWMRNLRVYGTYRTYPIRVANRPADGENSGPTFPDSKEISFEEINMKQEYTTVTKLPRRIFTWSNMQAMEANYQNRVDSAFLNFAQYCTSFKELLDIWHSLNESTNVTHIGFGPELDDIYRVGAPSLEFDKIRNLWEKYRAAAARYCGVD